MFGHVLFEIYEKHTFKYMFGMQGNCIVVLWTVFRDDFPHNKMT